MGAPAAGEVVVVPFPFSDLTCIRGRIAGAVGGRVCWQTGASRSARNSAAHGRASRLQQSNKTGLFKVVVRCDGFGQRVLSHDDETRTIDDAPGFVVVRFPQFPGRFLKRLVDVNDLDGRIGAEVVHQLNLLRFGHLQRSRQQGREFRQHITGRDEATVLLPDFIEAGHGLRVKDQ